MESKKLLPIGNISSAQLLGEKVRHKRKQDQLTQRELAELTGVGIRFLSELENGKPSVQFDKVLLILSGLGLKMRIEP